MRIFSIDDLRRWYPLPPRYSDSVTATGFITQEKSGEDTARICVGLDLAGTAKSNEGGSVCIYLDDLRPARLRAARHALRAFAPLGIRAHFIGAHLLVLLILGLVWKPDNGYFLRVR